jgi:hypothetical protein
LGADPASGCNSGGNDGGTIISRMLICSGTALI